MHNELRRTNSSPAGQSIQRRFDNRIDNQYVHWENLFESTPKGNPIMYTLLVFSACGMSVELRFIILNSKRLIEYCTLIYVLLQLFAIVDIIQHMLNICRTVILYIGTKLSLCCF